MQTIKNLFKVNNTKVSKHQASKKGFQHKHNLSKGQQNHLDFVKKSLIEFITK